MKTNEYLVSIARPNGNFVTRRVVAMSEENARHIVSNYGEILFVRKA
jgi:hypothetical protein